MSGPGSTADPLRVALVDPSGYSRPYDHELAAALAARGHDVTLWTSSFAHGEVPPADGYRVREGFYRVSGRLPVRVPLRRPAKAAEHPVGLAAMLASLLRRRPDVVHVQWVVMRPLERRLYRALARAGVPVVFTSHDSLPNVGGEAKARSVTATAAAFPHVIVHSSWGREVLASRAGLDPARVHQVPHGVLGHLAALPAEQPPVAHDGPLVALPGLMRPYKGIDVLLAAWPQVRAQVPRAGLALAGRPMMDVRGLRTDQPGVHFLPRFLEGGELAALVRRAEVVCLPYTRIDNSGVVFAALPLAAPLVLSDVGGFGELHREHGVGELVPPGDPEALARTLVRLLTRAPERERLAAASRAAAAAFAWDGIAERTEAVYRAAIADADGTDSSRAPGGGSVSVSASK